MQQPKSVDLGFWAVVWRIRGVTEWVHVVMCKSVPHADDLVPLILPHSLHPPFDLAQKIHCDDD